MAFKKVATACFILLVVALLAVYLSSFSSFVSSILVPTELKNYPLLSQGVSSPSYEIKLLDAELTDYSIFLHAESGNTIIATFDNKLMKVDAAGNLVDTFLLGEYFVLDELLPVIFGSNTYYDWVSTACKDSIPYKRILNEQDEMDEELWWSVFLLSYQKASLVKFDVLYFPAFRRRCLFFIDQEWHVLYLKEDAANTYFFDEAGTSFFEDYPAKTLRPFILIKHLSDRNEEGAEVYSKNLGKAIALKTRYFEKEDFSWIQGFAGVPAGCSWSGKGYYDLSYYKEVLRFKESAGLLYLKSTADNSYDLHYDHLLSFHRAPQAYAKEPGITFIDISKTYSSFSSDPLSIIRAGTALYVIKQKKH